MTDEAPRHAAAAGLSRAVFGSIAEAVMRRSEFPVFVIRLAAAEAQARAARAA